MIHKQTYIVASLTAIVSLSWAVHGSAGGINQPESFDIYMNDGIETQDSNYDQYMQNVMDENQGLFERSQDKTLGFEPDPAVTPIPRYTLVKSDKITQPSPTQRKGMFMQMTEKGNTYVITLNVPQLDAKKMDVKIEKNLISVVGSYSQTNEKKDKKGRVIDKQEISKTLSEGFSIPQDADYNHARIDRKPNGFEITLPKLEGGSV
jgi:HSP20 family molecular chaperone IbpA